MSPTRREFIKDMAAVGAVATVSVVKRSQSDTTQDLLNRNTCPYFDQPLHCKGLNRNGHPLAHYMPGKSMFLPTFNEYFKT